MIKNNSADIMESTFYKKLEKGYNKNSKYDYLVLFSGGKDSTYIVHKLKEAKGSRICLFTIENGLEETNAVMHAKETASKLNCDLYIYQPCKHSVMKFYKYLITEPELKKIDTNPVCFFCGRFFISLGIEFSESLSIPFVMYGATPEQVRQGKKTNSQRDVEIFEMVSKKVFNVYYQRVKLLDGYKKSVEIRNIFDKIFYTPTKTRLLFPFQFLDYNIEKIKMQLENTYNWQNPTKNLDNSLYLTSGCLMVNLFGLLSKKLGYKPHEPEQFKKNYEAGHMNQKTYEYNIKQINNIMKAEITPEIIELAKKIGVEDLLL